MTNKADEALKETNIDKKKTNLKISKKDTSKKTKKVILEAPILEQFSQRKSNIKIKPEQNAVGSFSDVQKSNTTLKPVTPRPNSLKNSQKLDTDQILLKPKKTLKLSINTIEDSIEELPEETIFEVSEEAKDTSKKDVTINQNASFFYEPSIFEKFDIKISTESNDSTLEENNSEGFDFVSNETPKELEKTEELEEKSEVVEEEYDFISTEILDIYKTSYSFEDTTISNDMTEINEENENSNNFLDSSISAVEEATSNSVFKEFSYEEEKNLPENEIIQTASPFAILNQVNENKPVIENNESLNNNLEVSAETNTLVLPSVNETILNSQEISEIPENMLTNIITPSANSNLEIDDIELSNEEIDKELDEVLGIESKKDVDDFSIEEYFGVTVNNKQENSVEKVEDVKDEKTSLSQPDVTSFSKLIEGFTQTISTLSNKISDLEANIVENENNKKMRTDAYLENILNSSIDDLNLDGLILEDINLDDISIDDINLDPLKIDEETSKPDAEISEENQSVENILMKAFDNSKIDNQMKQDLLSEVLSSEEVENTQDSISSTPVNSDVTSDFFKVIDSLSKTISELENNNEAEILDNKKTVVEETIEEPTDEIVEESLFPTSQIEENEVQTPIVSAPEATSEKAINILINKDDIFSISIANETYEIVTDFDGISVLSENIHISTPKNNFYVNIGEKYIEIHKQPDLFVVNTNFEDIEFANAINNVTFAKKKNKIELNIKEAFKISSINKKIELSMLNTSIANLTNSQNDSNENDESSVCDNKTLIINEENQKVYLPYTIEEVMKKLHNSSDYQSIQDVIDQEYTLPLSTFKMPIISRFKEAYRFMRVKEKSSVYAALDLAVELMFNSNLNPAIIRAAKDLKELNIYLDCLYENELDKFDCFKIIYKVLPKIQ